MVKVSIELITRDENTINRVLESINEQSFKDTEIIAVNSSAGHESEVILKKYNATVLKVPPGTGHLEARYLANKSAIGEYRIMLDSTRPLEVNALELLMTKYKNFSAVCLREGSIGQGFWVNQAKMLKKLSDDSFLKTRGKNIAYLLPRFYKGEILDSAFKYLKMKLSDNLFNSISYGEHHLIYEACNLNAEEVALTDEELINHYEDESLDFILQKYRRYGKAQKVLDNIEFNSRSKVISSHKRPFNVTKIGLELSTLPIRAVRGIAFLTGYLF